MSSFDASCESPPMTVKFQDDRLRRHADIWPSNPQMELEAVYQNNCAYKASNACEIQSEEESTTQRAGPVHQEYMHEGRERTLPHHQTDPVDGDTPLTPVDTSSNTPNARSSRLFRERRKEREKILRETITELAQRNAVLEGLLLSNAIAPPQTNTLRDELSIHRSQRLGGPPIQIPGVTTIRPTHSDASEIAPHFPCPRQPCSAHSFPGRTFHERTQPGGVATQTSSAYHHSTSDCHHGYPSQIRNAVGPSPPFQTFNELKHLQSEALSLFENGNLHDMSPRSRHGEARPAHSSLHDVPVQGHVVPNDCVYHSPADPLQHLRVHIVPDLTSPPSSAHSISPFHECSTSPKIEKRGSTHTHVRAPSNSALTRYPAASLAEQHLMAATSGLTMVDVPFPALSGHGQPLNHGSVNQSPFQSQLSNSLPWASELSAQYPHKDAHLCLPESSRAPIRPSAVLPTTNDVADTNRAAPLELAPSGSAASGWPLCPQEDRLPAKSLVNYERPHSSASSAPRIGYAVPPTLAHSVPHLEQDHLPAPFPLFPPFSTPYSTRLTSTPQLDQTAERCYVPHSVTEAELEDSIHADGQMPQTRL